MNLVYWVLIVVTFILITCLMYNIYLKVEMGEPPMNCMIVAYKYSYKDRKPVSSFQELNKSFPNHNLIKFCYCGSKPKHVEYANGVILQENVQFIDADLLQTAFVKGFSLFVTPRLGHSVYVKLPALSWMPITYLLGIFLSYPKIFSYIEERRLCGYPVIEVYRKNSLSVIVPLIRQDEFVVNEAIRVVNDFKFSAMLQPASKIKPASPKIQPVPEDNPLKVKRKLRSGCK